MGCVFIRQQVLQISIYGNRRFTQLFVPQASQSSYYRRTELEVLLAIPSAQSACGMEIFMTYGIFGWQAGEKSESREMQDAL